MFEQIIDTYKTDLLNYCRMLTGTPWDAEDLYQETLLKSYSYRSKLSHHPNPKAYMFRIASTTWIDHCRKNNVDIGEWEVEQFSDNQSITDSLIVKELVEEFASALPPKQAVVLLLVEVFKYKTVEVAEIIETSSGAVKSLLHRGRMNVSKQKKTQPKDRTPMELIEAFKEAITLKDPRVISRTYKDILHTGMQVQFLKDQKSFMLYDPEGNMIGVIKNFI